MSNTHTNPRLVCPTGQHDGTAAVLILAGHAGAPLPLDRPRLSVIGDELTLGRDVVCDSWSTDLDDALMSRRHARVFRDELGDYFVSDLGSTNGTWLDGRLVPLGTACRLREGAVIMMGGHVFVFRSLSHDDLAAIREDWACPFGPVPTLSGALARLVRKLSRLAAGKVDMLLSGETGVGKEVHADAIHRASGRPGQFIAINCAAIPENLVESELFGYARGAHSTADRGKPGLIERAEGGTLFLDEIGEMSPAAQTKLLRFLQSREFVSLGATRQRRLDVRVVAATNRSLDADQSGGAEGLRYDLLARLGPEPLALPPLRDRPEDVGVLAAFFADDRRVEFVPEAYQALFLHQWRGNVRELEKVVAFARVLAGPGRAIDLEHLPAPLAAAAPPPLKAVAARKRPTREELHTLLARHGGDVASMAREIGRQRTLVWRWLRESQLKPDDYRG